MTAIIKKLMGLIDLKKISVAALAGVSAYLAIKSVGALLNTSIVCTVGAIVACYVVYNMSTQLAISPLLGAVKQIEAAVLCQAQEKFTSAVDGVIKSVVGQVVSVEQKVATAVKEEIQKVETEVKPVIAAVEDKVAEVVKTVEAKI